MSKLRNLLLLLCTCLPLLLSAQKAYKPIRSALKSKNATQALQLIAPLMTDSNYHNDSRLYEYAISAHLLAHEAENTKAYLKQKYDTLKFFSSSLGIIKNILSLDSLDKAEQKEKAIAPKYAEITPRFLTHLRTAGRYFFLKKQFQQSAHYLNTYLSVPPYLVITPNQQITNDVATALLCTKSYLLDKQYDKVPIYRTLLLSDSTYHCDALEIYALAAKERKEEKEYLTTLLQGISTCRSSSFFFSRLIDLYISQNAERKALVLADSLLAEDSTNTIFMEGRCLALMSLHQHADVIAQGKRILQTDSLSPYPYYYIGASYCNLANSIAMPPSINSRLFKQANQQRKACYSTALPYLEKFRLLQPDKKQMWAPLLYKAYLSVENETKFKEIDAILQKL